MKSSITIEIKRPNGKIENVDVTDKFAKMTDNLLAAIKEQTEKAGRGEVLSATETWHVIRDNSRQLTEQYNNLHNEGGYGYVPPANTMHGFKTWEEKVVNRFNV